MSKAKYSYNPETLSYQKIEKSKSKIFANVFLVFLGIIGSGFVFLMSISYYGWIELPNEKMLKAENEDLNYHLQKQKKDLGTISDVLASIEERDNDVYRVIFETNPISNDIRMQGMGGTNRYKDIKGFDHSEKLIENAKKIDELTKRVYIQSKSLDEIEKLSANKEALLASIPAIQPVQNKDLKRMASGYGMRMHPILKYRRMHNGMDFTADTGTEILSTGDGKVIKASKNSGAGFGKHVIIDHGFGYTTTYGHMSKVNVRVGQKVKRSQKIGEVGNTGLSSGPHLHYEVHKNGKAVNPINFYHNDLTPEEYEILREKAGIENQSLD